MKKLGFFLTLAASAILLAISCKEKEPVPEIKDAGIEITLDATTINSITFTLTPENAAYYEYACVKAADEAFATFTKVEGNEAQQYTVSELEENTEYVIIATATNADGKTSARKTVKATTTSAASASIHVRNAMAKAVEFTVSPVNAAYFEYAFAKSSEAASAEFIKVEETKTQVFLIEDLEPETEYTISARATNSNGETGETAVEKFTTAKLATASIDEITPAAKTAVVKVNCTDTDSLFYYVGSSEPSAEDYTRIKVENNAATFTAYDLEPETEYTVWVYLKDKNGYAGETVSSKFTTITRGNIGIEVSNIGMRDADIEIFFNKEMYSKVYFMTGTSDKFPEDPKTFPWESYLSRCKTFEEDFTGKYSELANSVKAAEKYMVGIIAEDTEGYLLTDVQAWAEIATNEAKFGVSDIKLEFEYNATSTAITYTVKAENASSFWAKIEKKDKISTNEEYALKNSNYGINKDFEKTYSSSNLTPEYDYVLMGFAIDANGNYGPLTAIDIKTPEITLNGKGSAEVELLTVGHNTVNINCTFGENTAQTRFLAVLKNNDPDYPTEKDIINGLVVGNKKTILYSNSDNKSLASLKADSDYIIYYTTLDNENNYSQLQSIEVHTKNLETIDGNATVNTPLMNSYTIEQNGFTYGRLDYEIQLGENCKGFYRCWLRNTDVEGKTDVQILEKIVSGAYYFNDTYQKTAENVSLNSYLIIVPVDNQDRLSPMMKIKLEGTFQN